MFKRHYLTGVLVFLSLIAGSAVANAAAAGIKTVPHGSIERVAHVGQGAVHRHGAYRPFYGNRGLYDYAEPGAVYGFDSWYDNQWDSTIWSTGNGYY